MLVVFEDKFFSTEKSYFSHVIGPSGVLLSIFFSLLVYSNRRAKFYSDSLAQLADERNEMNEELRKLYNRHERVREGERTHIAREIHDELGQTLTAIKLAEIIQEADLPPGVVNIINGDGKTGRAMVEHPDVNKIAFTGSTDVGKLIMHSVAGTGKKYTLELGGKAANIIFEDAAIDQAVEGIVNAIFFNQGHVCCAGSRLYVQEGVAEEVISKLQKRMESLIVGDPLDKNTDIGAINSKMQLNKIKKYVKLGKDEGGTIYQSSCPLPEKGYWFAPTIFTDVSQSNRIVQEEIFGPVLAIQTFRTVDEVILKANNSPYGLSGGLWTDKGSKIFKVTQDIRAGVIWANTFNKFDPASPFGGYKESGVGSEGGIEGLSGYVNLV